MGKVLTVFLGPEGIPYAHIEKEIKMADSKAFNFKSFIHNSADILNVLYARCSSGARDVTVNDLHKLSSFIGAILAWSTCAR